MIYQLPARTLLIPETGRPTPLLSKTDKVGGVSLAGNKKGERGQYINSFIIFHIERTPCVGSV